MDPATLSLIFMGVRVIAQGMQATGARRKFVDSLEGVLSKAHAEGRTISPEEVMEFAERAARVNMDYRDQLEEFLKAIGENPAPVEPRPYWGK